jgi:parvulin-like peptidyl-prolyl isomerase
MMKKWGIFLLSLTLILIACQREPKEVTVQHVLIAFQGSIPKPEVTRTQEDAESLAAEIFQRATDGEDFDALVKEYSDDAYPGVYKMANFDVSYDEVKGVFSRSRMVKSFGDVGFSLDVGDVGLAEYDPVDSKYGWHIIKRIE